MCRPLLGVCVYVHIPIYEMILTNEGWIEWVKRMSRSSSVCWKTWHGGEMLEHFTNIWNAITHKSFWDCKLKISCVERDSKYFERDLNILISLRLIFLLIFFFCLLLLLLSSTSISGNFNSSAPSQKPLIFVYRQVCFASCSSSSGNVNIYASLMKISFLMPFASYPFRVWLFLAIVTLIFNQNCTI